MQVFTVMSWDRTGDGLDRIQKTQQNIWPDINMFKCTMDTMTCQVDNGDPPDGSQAMFWMAWWIGYSVLRTETASFAEKLIHGHETDWLRLWMCRCWIDLKPVCFFALNVCPHTPCSWNDVTRFEGRVSPWHKLARCCQLSHVVTLGCWKLRSQVRELYKTKLVGGLEPWNFMTFHSVGNVIIPTDFHSIIFQRGRSTTNQITNHH